MSIIVRTLSDQAYELVRARIVSGMIAPGSAIRQEALAEELGVSKIPLREALTRLEQDALLSSSPNRGYTVRPLSPDEAEEIFALRLKLEPEAAARATARATAQDHADARAALARIEAAGADAELGAANRAFHLALARPGLGLVTRQLIERLHVLAERYVRRHLEGTGREARADSEHRALLEAWIAGDGARVETLCAAHIAETLADLRQELGTAPNTADQGFDRTRDF